MLPPRLMSDAPKALTLNELIWFYSWFTRQLKTAPKKQWDYQYSSGWPIEDVKAHLRDDALADTEIIRRALTARLKSKPWHQLTSRAATFTTARLEGAIELCRRMFFAKGEKPRIGQGRRPADLEFWMCYFTVYGWREECLAPWIERNVAKYQEQDPEDEE